MQTFKQFLMLEEPLEEIAAEMWLRLNLTQKNMAMIKEIAHWVVNPDSVDWELQIDAMQVLYDYFGDEIPYEVAKGRSDISVEEWMHEMLVTRMMVDGIDVGGSDSDERDISDFI
jgi:hypothetical protein